MATTTTQESYTALDEATGAAAVPSPTCGSLNYGLVQARQLSFLFSVDNVHSDFSYHKPSHHCLSGLRRGNGTDTWQLPLIASPSLSIDESPPALAVPSHTLSS